VTAPSEWLSELTSGDEARAEAAAQALAALPEGAALPDLRALLAPAEGAAAAEARWWAARALALIPGPEAAALLLALLDDPDEAVRACAVAGLGEHARPEAAPRLAALLGDASPFLARLAGDALIRTGPAAAPELLQALQDMASAQRRAQAARALAHLALPETIPALFRALEDESALVQHWADEGLERLGVGMVYFNA
jgi:HEAT repeat protein